MTASRKNLQKRIGELRDLLRRHEHLYYVLDAPEISDAEYDQMMLRLKELEAQDPSLITPDSPTQRVGGKPREGVVQARHSVPMMSLDNAYSEDELRDFDRRVHEITGKDTGKEKIDYVAEMKLESEFDILGLFQGVGLPFQSDVVPSPLPNMVWLYRRPILDYWAEHDETLGHIITHVLVHEIGHHFGLSDDDMESIEASVK